MLLIFISFFSFQCPRQYVPDHRQKWRVLFFTRIKLVARVLACAHERDGRGFESHSEQISIATPKKPSVIHSATPMLLGNVKLEYLYLRSGCKCESISHGLMQSVIAPEQYLVVSGSISIRAISIATLKIPPVANTIYINSFYHTHVINCAGF